VNFRKIGWQEQKIWKRGSVGRTPHDEQSFMQSKLAEQLVVLDRLADPRVPVHQTTTILRVSTIHKLDHWLRNVEPDVMLLIAKAFDQQVRQCLYNKMDLNQQLNAALRTVNEVTYLV
jgi:hypothetical protein